MKTVIPAPPGYYFVKVSEDGSDNIRDVTPEPIIAWEIEDGFAPWPLTLNRRHYLLRNAWEGSGVLGIILPDGRLMTNLGETMYASLEEWLSTLREIEAVNTKSTTMRGEK